MKPLEALQMLARGQRPRDALLPPCRLEGLGTQAYGEEAIVSHFRNTPMGSLEATDVVVTPSHIAIFAGEAVLFADVFGDHILRIWRLGPGEPSATQPAIGVAFDTDLFQSRRDAVLRMEDHRELHADAKEIVEQIGYSLAHEWTPEDGSPALRARPFCLRAFSNGNIGAALFAVHRLGSGKVRSAGFAFAAARFALGKDGNQEPLIVRDLAGEKAVEKAVWRTRFV